MAERDDEHSLTGLNCLGGVEFAVDPFYISVRDSLYQVPSATLKRSVELVARKEESEATLQLSSFRQLLIWVCSPVRLQRYTFRVRVQRWGQLYTFDTNLHYSELIGSRLDTTYLHMM